MLKPDIDTNPQRGYSCYYCRYIFCAEKHNSIIVETSLKSGCEICLPFVTFCYLSLSLVTFPGLTEPYWALLDLTGPYYGSP